MPKAKKQKKPFADLSDIYLQYAETIENAGIWLVRAVIFTMAVTLILGLLLAVGILVI